MCNTLQKARTHQNVGCQRTREGAGYGGDDGRARNVSLDDLNRAQAAAAELDKAPAAAPAPAAAATAAAAAAVVPACSCVLRSASNAATASASATSATSAAAVATATTSTAKAAVKCVFRCAPSRCSGLSAAVGGVAVLILLLFLLLLLLLPPWVVLALSNIRIVNRSFHAKSIVGRGSQEGRLVR